MNAHPTLAKTGQLALMVLIATVVRAPPGLEERTAKQVSKVRGGMVLSIKALNLIGVLKQFLQEN